MAGGGVQGGKVGDLEQGCQGLGAFCGDCFAELEQVFY